MTAAILVTAFLLIAFPLPWLALSQVGPMAGVTLALAGVVMWALSFDPVKHTELAGMFAAIANLVGIVATAVQEGI